jgi:hypothetical protein
MHGCKLCMLWVIPLGVVDQVLQQKQVSGTSLDYGKEPISQFQFAAAGVGFLSCEEIRKLGIIMRVRSDCSGGVTSSVSAVIVAGNEVINGVYKER